MRFIVFVMLFLPSYQLVAQQKSLNIPGLHQLVNDSKSENKLQIESRNQQTVVSATEHENKTLLAKAKLRLQQIQSRYRVLGTAISAVNIGLNATPLLDRILQQQNSILKLAVDQPALLPLALQSESEFASRGYELVNFLIALAVSIGDVNQMKAGDRQILFDHILYELNAVESLSQRTLNAMRYSGHKNLISNNPFRSYINQDKALVEDIIRNAKGFK